MPRPQAAGLKPVADDQLLKFDQNGKFILQIGKSNQSKGNADTANVHRAADVWVHQPTNEVFVADGYGNHRVIVFDADTGAFKRMWGAFGNKPVDDDIARMCRSQISRTPARPQNFSIVHSIRVANDGTGLRRRPREPPGADVHERRQVRKAAGQDRTPFARNVSLSPDPAQQFLYVGDGKEIAILDRKTLEIGRGQGQGVIGGGHLATTDSKGNIYVAATGQGMQRLTFKGISATASR